MMSKAEALAHVGISYLPQWKLNKEQNCAQCLRERNFVAEGNAETIPRYYV
jgi:hypothetical protein